MKRTVHSSAPGSVGSSDAGSGSRNRTEIPPSRCSRAARSAAGRLTRIGVFPCPARRSISSMPVAKPG
jgi:hypothetical protein